MGNISIYYSLDAIIFLTILFSAYNLILIVKRRNKALQILHVSGLIVFLFSLSFLNTGITLQGLTEQSNLRLWMFFLAYWANPGIFISLFYLNTKDFFTKYKETDSNKVEAILRNVVVFIGYPLSSMGWALSDKELVFALSISDPAISIVVQSVVVSLLGGALILFGYRKVLVSNLIHGVLFGFFYIAQNYANSKLYALSTFRDFTLNFILTPLLLLLLMSFYFILNDRYDIVYYGDKPPLPEFVMNLRIAWAAFKVLKEELGWKKTLALLPALTKLQKQGKPWDELKEPQSRKDRESRALIGDAILVYRILRSWEEFTEQRAEKIVKKMIKEAALQQLFALIPQFKKETLEQVPEEKREAVLSSIVEKFPNTDWHVVEVKKNRIVYHITRCRLVELVQKLGHPELSDAFCPGDITYFEEYQPNIKLIRPCTIGIDEEEYCDFQFEIAKEQEKNEKATL